MPRTACAAPRADDSASMRGKRKWHTRHRADDSGSMAFEDGGDRIDDLKGILSRVAEVATLFDDDGIQVRFINR